MAYNHRRTKGPSPTHVEAARTAVIELATNEASRMQREAMRPGVDPIERDRILGEAEEIVREAVRWAEALGTPGVDPGHLVTDLHTPGAPVLERHYGDDTMPAPAWALGQDGEGCVQVQHALHAPARNAEAMLNHLLTSTGDPDKTRDRLAWAAAVVLGQRDLPESEVIRGMVHALEDAVMARVTQDAAGIVTWARKEAPAAFGRLVDMSKFSSSMKTKHQATLDVLAMGGLAPTKKLEVKHTHELIDEMTREELDRYAKTGVMPARLLTIQTTAERIGGQG